MPSALSHFIRRKTPSALIHFNHSDSEGLTTWPDMRTSSWKPNYGDMLVCAAILRQLQFHETVQVTFGVGLRVTVDSAIVRGSTYLHNDFDFAAANKTLDSIKSPLAIVGLGAQNPTQDLKFLDGNAGAKGFIARLNEKSRSISVRGSFTAAIVERLGGKHIRITGCPSMFYALQCPQVVVPAMLRRPERSLGISLHTGLSQNIFCHSPQRARQLHGSAIRFALQNAGNVSLFEQGVMREFSVADRQLALTERLALAEQIHADIDGGDSLSAYDLVARMVSVKSIEEWISKARDLDAMIGFRFHGNMIALLQGTPCYHYVYDSRIKEFCDTYGLPHMDVNNDWADPIQSMLEHDWSTTNGRIAIHYSELKEFYAENGFKCKLP